MRKNLVLGFCITALMAFAVWAPTVLAYSSNGNCTNCHNWFANNSSHDRHQNRGISCSLCHDNNTANSCATCHDAVPLQTRHVDNYSQSCDDCHTPPPPPAETNCSDGIDNNGNGLTDCADPDCGGFVFPNPETTCGQGACASTGNLECRNLGQFDTCQPGSPTAEGPFDDASCSDTIDNDCDGDTDANDSDCTAPPEVCDDGIDNNGNGLVDCADPQCDGFAFTDVTTCGVGACASTGSVICQNSGEFDTCQPFTPGAEGPFDDASCGDGIDNDCDGDTDTNDSDCTAPPEVCDDGVDNNGNGLVDCADPQCDGFTFTDVTTCGVGACAATGNLECRNLGQVDTCQPGTPENEGPYGDPSCSDGIDNNCNNQADDADSSCQPGPEICDNNIDDNNDGLVDCADPQCDGFVGQPGSCTTSLSGICSAGTIACDLGEKFCEQDTQAATEGPFSSPTCNDGLDNDCDDLADASDPDCDEPPADNDGDGFTEDVDCNDSDSTINPGAEEICGNSVDENCDGLVETCPPADNDGDGFTEDVDCNDSDSAINPGAEEICGNGVDENCDGMDETCLPDPVCGDGIVNDNEQCDDGNSVNGDGCENNCTFTPTGSCNDEDLPVVTEMEYNRGDKKLHLHGRAEAGTITVANAITGETLAEDRQVREGNWEAEINNVNSSLKSIIIISSNRCAIVLDIRKKRGNNRGRGNKNETTRSDDD